MPDILASALSTPGLIWILVAAFVSGTVRGFTGFGTAMIFLPVAGQYLNPFQALAVLITMDLFGPLPIIPAALKNTKISDILRLLAGVVIGVPIGLFFLTLVPEIVFRYSVSAVALTLLVVLVAGIRYRGVLTKKLVYLTGVLSGIFEGAVGLAGPPVIFLYMASDNPARVIRATTLIFLTIAGAMILPFLAVFGKFDWSAMVLGLVAAVPYLVANVLGAILFRPDMERTYRFAAYIIIAASAITGLPLFD